MIAFVLAAGIALLVAVAFAAVPLLRSGPARASVDRRRVNVALYRQRADEIERERAAGGLSVADARALTEELAATLLDDDPRAVPPRATSAAPRDASDAASAAASPRAVGTAVSVGVAVVALSLMLYHLLGAYDAVQLRDAARVMRDENPSADALRDLTQQLRARVAAVPADAESWYLLGLVLMRQDDPAGAVTAFERLTALAGDDPNARIALAQARFAAAGGTLTDDNRALLEQILADDPRQSVALEMLALDAFRRADYASAARHLERALASGAAGARAESLEQGLTRARALLAAAGTAGRALDVTVEVGGAAQNLPPDAALFVFARRPGERMPLLVARRAVTAQSMTVRLDQANAMNGDVVTLVEGQALDVAARLSRSGSVTSSGADPQAQRDGVVLHGAVTAVNLELGSAGDGVAAGPAQTRAAAQGAAMVIRLNVALAPGLAAAPPARVFVIARAPNGPPMPIAVRAVDPAALPEQLELTDRDAMQPGRPLSMFDRIEVIARLSRSGNPTRQSGDVESSAVVLDPRAAQMVSLVIGG